MIEINERSTTNTTQNNMARIEDLMKSLYSKNSSIRSKILFSEIKKEIYIFIQESNVKYNFIIFCLNKNIVTVQKEMKFIYNANKQIVLNNPDIILNSSQNQMSFFNRDYIGFLNLNLKENFDEEFIQVPILHTSLLDIDKDKRDISSSSYFKKFKYSNFDDYFGVLFSDNTFRLYSTKSRVSKLILSDISSEQIVDFAFGSNLSFGWQVFSIFFMDISGSVMHVCPIFPEEFSLKKEYLDKMNKFYKNIRLLDSFKSENIMLDENLLFHLEQSIIKDHKDKECYKIKIDNYLNNTMNKVTVKNFSIIQRRNEEEEFIQFKQLFILDAYPVTLLRVDENNVIDVLVLNDDISPIRQDSLHDKDLFLIEKINLNISIRDDIKVLSEEISNKKYSLVIRVLNNVFQLNMPYIHSLKKCFTSYNGKEDLSIGKFITEITPLILFEETSNNKADFGIIKIDKSLVVFAYLERAKKYYVKTVPISKEKNQINEGKDDKKFQEAFEKNLNKIELGMRRIFCKENFQLQRLEEMCKKV